MAYSHGDREAESIRPKIVIVTLLVALCCGAASYSD